MVAENTATGQVKYFLANAPARVGLRTLLRVAFMRWHVEYVFRVAKSEIGLTHYEGRHYVGLVRHLVLCAVALGLVALHTERLRGKNPDLTLEQVCQALNVRCAALLERGRGAGRLRHTAEVIQYHQRRNAAACKSKKKRHHRRC